MHATRIWLMVAVVASSVALGHAQRRAELTPDDYAEIYRLYGQSAFAFDKVEDVGQRWAGLFTADGVFVDMAGKSVSGHDQLALYAWEQGLRSPMRWITFNNSILLEPTATGVKGKAYVLTMNMNGQQPTSLRPAGMFFDLIEKTPQGWKFKQRTLVAPDAPVPSSVPAAFRNETR